MLRSVIPVAVGLAVQCSVLGACTAPNPAYRFEDFPRNGNGGPSASFDASRPPDLAPASACGTERPDLKDLLSVDSMAIDRAGNIYFSNEEAGIARIGKLPPRGAGADRQWLAVTTGVPLRGMAIDGQANVLYYTAGTPTAELQAVDLNAPTPIPRTVYRGLIDPNDVVVGPDGKVYVSDQGDNQIYSFTASGQKTTVTTSAIGVMASSTGPAGLTFAPDGKLVVGVKAYLPLVRLTIGADGKESAREEFGGAIGWVNGVVFDQRGRLYLALYHQTLTKNVVRLDSDTAAPVTVVQGGRFSAIAWGQGALGCKDLYVSEPFAGLAVRRVPDAAELP